MNQYQHAARVAAFLVFECIAWPLALVALLTGAFGAALNNMSVGAVDYLSEVETDLEEWTNGPFNCA